MKALWLCLAVILVSLEAAIATPSVVSPLPSLEGKETYLATGKGGDMPGLNGRLGWYTLCTPWEAVSDNFADSVRLLGGRIIPDDSVARDGMRVMRFTVRTSMPGATSVGVGTGWYGQGGAGASWASFNVRVTMRIDRVEKKHGRITVVPIGTWYGEANSPAYAAGADIPVGSYRGFPVNVGIRKAKTFAWAEQTAIELALQDLLDRGKRRATTSEPIIVQSVDYGQVAITAGTTRGIREGQTFSVFRKGASRVNPDTDEVLDQNVVYIATIQVSSVKTQVAFCDVIEGDLEMIAAGDRVVRSNSAPSGAPKKTATEPAVAPDPI